MGKKELVIIADYNNERPLTLTELCEVCHISADFMQDLIAYEIIHPVGSTPDEWIFDLGALNRVKKVLRLQHDLEVNLAGIALALDLLDELHSLRAKMALITKHYL